MKKKTAGIISFIIMIFSIISCKSLETAQNFYSLIDSNMLNKIQKGSNMVISPISIKFLLTLLANGTGGQAQTEILNSLGFDNLLSANENMRDIYSSLKNNHIIENSNSVWINKDSTEKNIKFKNSFLNNIDQFLSAEAHEVENSNAVSKINDWVKNKTHNKINEIIDSPYFEAVLLNSVYFKKNWGIAFNNIDKKLPFQNKDGNWVETEFMEYKGTLNYYQDPNFKMVEIPYSKCNTSMYVFLNETPEYMLDFHSIQNALLKKQNGLVELKLPKFTTQTSLKLNEDVGITQVFDPNTSSIKDYMFENCKSDVRLSKIIHKSFIEVNQHGTEAAAVTGGMIKLTCCNPKYNNYFKLYANKPFTYLIIDNSTNEILFLGNQAEFQTA